MKRIYVVQDNSNGEFTLVEAHNSSMAVAYAASAQFKAEVVGSSQLLKLIEQGYKVESSTKTSKGE